MTAYPKAPKQKRAKGRARPDEPLADFCEVGRIDCCTGRPAHRHHRLTRGQGGTDDASNTLDCCSACHSLIHARPSLAYARGWMIRGAGRAS